MKTDTQQQTKHTPGPWRVMPHDDENTCEIWDSNGAFASCEASNARLIAAAPDLLAFAKWAEETLIGESGAAWSHWEQFPEFRAGMKAIEKAEGRA